MRAGEKNQQDLQDLARASEQEKDLQDLQDFARRDAEQEKKKQQDLQDLARASEQEKIYKIYKISRGGTPSRRKFPK